MGQTTLIVFALMLGALLTMDLSWLLSGVLLGFALSKYSVALPALLFLLMRRKYRVVAVAAIVQALGLLIIAWLGQESPLSVLGQYGREFSIYAALSEPFCGLCIHLANFVQHGSRLAYLVIYAGAAIIVAGLWVWAVRSLPARASGLTFGEFHLFSILVLVSLLAVYHHNYDSGPSVVFVGLLVCGLQGDRWNLSTAPKRGLWVFLAAFMVAMNLPAEVLGTFLSAPLLSTWMGMVNGGMMVGLLAALVVSLWLLLRLKLNGSGPRVASSFSRPEAV